MMESKERENPVVSGGRMDPVLAPLALAFKRTISLVERETGIAGMKWFVLMILARRDGASQGEVCQEYEVDPSRITRTAQSMERDGLIRRERAPEDNRVVRMYLTDEGRLMIEEMPQVNEEIRRRALDVLGEKELKELRRMLGLLSEAMK